MFAWILSLLSLATGLVWLLDLLWLARRRKAQAPEGGEAAKPGFFVDLCVSFFPVIFAVFMLRSFVVEPFRIPSGSMIPTLHVGDFILVNKFSYGLRCPVGSCKLIATGEPKRGDVVVFRFPGSSPEDPARGTDFIKRLIGVPGDHVHYEDKTLTVNGDTVKLGPDGLYDGDFEGGGVRQLMHEDFSGIHHDIIVNPQRPAESFDYTVPPGEYFMMGDNRDGSYDSRYWGPVPDANLRGRAFLIWMSWDFPHWHPVLSRIGTVIR